MNEITMKLNADRLIRMALEEDITSEDITTNSVMRKKQMGEVQLLCKETGVIAGIWVFERVFTLLDENTETEFYVKDGDKVEKGQLLGLVKGDIRVLLSGERTALNYLQRMSGIATYTSQIADLLKGSRTKLLDTRKTTPNMRIFEKYAVKTGGGYNHRYNLSDGILLKDNHIGAAGSVKKAVEMARKEGIKIGILRPITLWPFPKDEVKRLGQKSKGVLVVEMNAGQMIEDVKLAVGNDIPVEHFGRLGGIVPSPDEILEAFKQKFINK